MSNLIYETFNRTPNHNLILSHPRVVIQVSITACELFGVIKRCIFDDIDKIIVEQKDRNIIQTSMQPLHQCRDCTSC